MATTKIWNIVDNLSKVINYSENGKKTEKTQDLKQALNYAMNDDKTEKQYFVSGINCEINSALEEMNNVKKYYNKKTGNIGYHAVQSFKENEVTPELAHKIGVEMAKELWGDRFQVVVTTHLNTNHIHNHFVINSVSFVDGKKYYDNHYTYALIRAKSDEICAENNLYVLKENECKYTKINYNNFYTKYEEKNNYTALAKRDIDFAISQAYSYIDFKKILYKLEYQVEERYGKINVRHKNTKRNIRIERRFGDNYSMDNIKKRILEEQAVRIPFIEDYFKKRFSKNIKSSKKKFKVKGFMAIYFHYMYLLKLYPKNPYKKLTPAMRADIKKMDIFSNEAKLLAENKITNNLELENFISNKENDLSNQLQKRNTLWKARSREKDNNSKVKICNQISDTTEIINRLRREVELCRDIKQRIPEMKNNIKELKNNENNKVKEKNIKKERI